MTHFRFHINMPKHCCNTALKSIWRPATIHATVWNMTNVLISCFANMLWKWFEPNLADLKLMLYKKLEKVSFQWEMTNGWPWLTGCHCNLHDYVKKGHWAKADQVIIFFILITNILIILGQWFPILVREYLQHCMFLMSLLSDTLIWNLVCFNNELMSWISCVWLDI